MKNRALFLLIGLCLLSLPVQTQTTLLHEFAGDVYDGVSPCGDLVLSGSTLYGMTEAGGAGGLGTIIKIETDGSGYTVLHEFFGGADDGATPWGSLVVAGTTLYGMTQNGGNRNMGTIFKIETDGSGYTLLHEFDCDVDSGGYPYGSLILSGSTLYGMAPGGGSSYMGTIFKIETDGSGFTLLHKFTNVASDPRSPYGSLILSGSTLYGMTRLGGTGDWGTIFKIQTDGSSYSLLHVFAGGANDGGSPYADLILSGTTIYGMTSRGGDVDYGSVFKIQTNGTGYSLLHEFAGGASDGLRPYGSLIISGSTLYGMTYFGGDGNLGTIFRIEADGSQFSLLHKFAGGADDGAYPYGSLILSGLNFYGMTRNGGDSDAGVIFSLPLPSSLTVTSPNGGETWVIGASQDITWSSTGTVENVDIDYSTDDGSSWTSVAVGTENDGSFTWTVPDSPSSTCLVRVTSTASPDITDSSDDVFAISAPFVAVTSPNGGEEWQRGTTQTITWGSSGVADVKIQLRKGSAVYSTITPSTPAAGGSYSWAVPKSQPVAANYRIRIVSTEASAVADVSDANFTIFKPSITVTSPAAGSVWVRNTTQAITWTTKGTVDGNVKIQLYKGFIKKLDITTSTENTGSFDWLIPAGLATGTYTIRVVTVDNKVKGKSGVFTITSSDS
jgi:uncharacterized repeat protein (TIGR03803 family)